MQAEGLLLLKSVLNENCPRPWYPHSLVYAGYSQGLELFARAKAKSEFEKLKRFLGVSSKQELLSKFAVESKEAGMLQWRDFVVQGVEWEVLFRFQELDTM